MEDFGSAVDRQVDAEGIAPAAVVRVVLKAYRKISISYCLGKLLRFVPEFVISCPDLGRNNQYTTVHKCETTEGKINETFQFVLPADKTETTLIIEMSGENCFFRKIAGKVVIPLSIGNTEDLTINFSKAGGELDIEVSFIVRYFFNANIHKITYGNS
uniref:uncharacterized protein LOC113474521 isoform X1 n=1 Tax=Ciona intestinalis TaxID=7719 RepID=UPI000EF54371|nr:uncharacterized protein LOC113474521 isoform X1 [Ciona intestinalis]|eukprot:XP_026691718.1 uncharacterized protein LOC113474521 isoform X1 [Ciona intestinalis]